MLKVKNGIIQNKEIDGIKIFVDLIPESNKTSRPKNPMTPKGITLHNVGNPGTTAEQNSNFVDHTTSYLSWHLTIGKGVIYQELPFNENGWHAGDGGSGEGNRTTIAIEICDNDESIETARKFLPYLMKHFGFGKDVIYPHKHWNGKNCPSLILPYWDEYIASIELEEPELHSIMTIGKFNAKELINIVNNKNPKLNCPLEELANYFIEECKIEGVNHDYAWCQSLHETGHFAFGGLAKPEWNNYSGLGVTGQKDSNGNPLGNKFETPRMGVRAQVQHLKAYASKESLIGKCIDERFDLVKRGSAPYVEWLGYADNPNKAGWAYLGAGYGGKILSLYDKLKHIENSNDPEIIVEPVEEVEYRLLHTIQKDGNYKVTFKNFKKGMEIYVKETK